MEFVFFPKPQINDCIFTDWGHLHTFSLEQYAHISLCLWPSSLLSLTNSRNQRQASNSHSFSLLNTHISKILGHVAASRYKAVGFKPMIYFLKLGVILGRKLERGTEGRSLPSVHDLQGFLLELEEKNQTEGFFSF